MAMSTSADDGMQADDAQAVFEGVARYCGLLSEPMRVRILHSICNDEKSVSQIVQETGASQTNVSRHLNTLYSANVLTRRKRGNFVYYQVKDHGLTEICRMVCTNVIASSNSGSDLDDQAMEMARAFQGANI